MPRLTHDERLILGKFCQELLDIYSLRGSSYANCLGLHERLCANWRKFRIIHDVRYGTDTSAMILIRAFKQDGYENIMYPFGLFHIGLYSPDTHSGKQRLAFLIRHASYLERNKDA